jgi:hypothetical protein
MAHFKKITTTLSVATTVLLEACSSAGSGSEPGPEPVPNTTAPELVATWQTSCVLTSNSGSSTVTQASGGTGSGSGGTADGEAFRSTAVFNQNGRVEFSIEYFATSNCNANTLSGTGLFNAVYFVGETGLANDGSLVTAISYSDSSSTTYSIFQVLNGLDLYLGDETASSPGNDGSSTATRLDGLGPKMLKQ